MKVLVPKFTHDFPRREVYIVEHLPPYRILIQGYIDQKSLEYTIVTKHPHVYLRRSPIIQYLKEYVTIGVNYNVTANTVILSNVGNFGGQGHARDLLPKIHHTHTMFDIYVAQEYPDQFQILDVNEKQFIKELFTRNG